MGLFAVDIFLAFEHEAWSLASGLLTYWLFRLSIHSLLMRYHCKSISIIIS